MASLIIKEAYCKACEYCIQACPRKALRPSGHLNKQGYQYVAVDDALCIKCGICYTVCPDYVFEIVGDE